MKERKVESVRPIHNFNLVLEFTGGEYRLFNLRVVFERCSPNTVFQEILNNEELFKTVKLDNTGTICWDNKADIAVEFLYFNSELIQVGDEHKSNLLFSSIACNMCGLTKELIGDIYEIETQKNEFQSFKCSFHYGSRYDYEQCTFDICEDCLTDFVKSFKHVPKGFGIDRSF